MLGTRGIQASAERCLDLLDDMRNWGERVYRERIELADTGAFGSRVISKDVDLTGRSWVRLEAWDAAANGAYTQPVWLEAGPAAGKK